MNFPTALYVFRWLVWDTFRQSLSSRTFWLILGLSGLCIVFCLSVSIEGATAHLPPGEIELYGADRQPYTGMNKGEGYLALGFGSIHLRLFRDGKAEVLFLVGLLARWGAGAVGMLLVLLWTSGFLPEFLQPSAVSVLLAKPLPRWFLLVGKFLAVLVFVAFQAAIFVGGTWLALGLATGFWIHGYLIAIPLLVFAFAMLYGIAVLLAVWTRNPVLCLSGTLLFWMACAAVHVGHCSRHAPGAPAPSRAIEAAYWTLPKPQDLDEILGQVLHTDKHFGAAEHGVRIAPAKIDLELSLLTSFLFTLLVLGAASHQLARSEY